MKKNRIIAGLSAIMMGATMMASTAMSASAISVYDTNNTLVGDGGFYTYYDSNGDGTSEWAPAPTKFGIDMYDDMISSAIDNGDDTYTLTLHSVSNTAVGGSIVSIVASSGTDNLIVNNVVTLEADEEYTATISATLFGIPVHNEVKTIRFHVE